MLLTPSASRRSRGIPGTPSPHPPSAICPPASDGLLACCDITVQFLVALTPAAHPISGLRCVLQGYFVSAPNSVQLCVQPVRPLTLSPPELPRGRCWGPAHTQPGLGTWFCTTAGNPARHPKVHRPHSHGDRPFLQGSWSKALSKQAAKVMTCLRMNLKEETYLWFSAPLPLRIIYGSRPHPFKWVLAKLKEPEGDSLVHLAGHPISQSRLRHGCECAGPRGHIQRSSVCC